MIDLSITEGKTPIEGLSPTHQTMLLNDSVIDPQVAIDRGYRTVTVKRELKDLGFTDTQQRVPALLIPLHDIDGEVWGYQIRPDEPRLNRDGKLVKYDTPLGQSIRVDVPKIIRHQLGDPSVPLWITEGSRKADSAATKGLCCVALLGVWGFRGTNGDGGKTALPCWQSVALRGRRVFIAYDSDSTSNPQVCNAMRDLGSFLRSKSADVKYVHIPTHDGRKVGMDDWFASGGTVATLVSQSYDISPSTPGVKGYGDAGKIEFSPTDQGNAERMIAESDGNFHFCAIWGKWLVWDGRCWILDETGGAPIRQHAVATIRKMILEGLEANDEGKMLKWASGCLSKQRLDAMIALAKDIKGVAIAPSQLDNQPWLLNVANGTIDLTTGELCGFNRDDRLTKIVDVNYDENAKCDNWKKFLGEIFGGDGDLGRYVWKALGYTLTGSTQEQKFFFLYGTGSNGKSTFVDAISSVLGEDYARQTATETFMAKIGDAGINNDIARLRAARAVFAPETESGKRLNEQLIKVLTGGDKIIARFLHQEFFEFRPEFKVWMSGNHKPEIRGTDHAIWRRVICIPFNVTFSDEQKDVELPEKLRAERAGILKWMVDGCKAWRIEKLNSCDAIVNAIEEYRTENDTLGGFLDEHTIVDSASSVRVKDLYERYRLWCKVTRNFEMNLKRFGQSMKERGEGSQRSTSAAGGSVYVGRRLIETDQNGHIYRGSGD